MSGAPEMNSGTKTTMKSPKTITTRLNVLPILIAAGLVASIGHASTLDSVIANQAHRLVIGDYNGDGAADLLLQGRPEDEHAQVLSGVMGASVQRWSDGFLGLTWNRKDTQLIVGDFDGNASGDVLLQATSPTNLSEVMLSSENGQPEASRQTLGDYHLGLRWDAQHHMLVVGDFNGDSRDDVFLQGRQNRYRHAVAFSAADGTFDALALDFDNTHLDIDWAADQHQLIAGDFDGNGVSELLLQPYRGDALYRVESGVALLDTATPIPADHLGLNWHVDAHRLVVGDFTGDGRDDVFLLATRNDQASALVPSDTEGFVRIKQELRDIPNLDQLRQVLVGDFDADGIDDLILLYTNPDYAPLLLLADEARRQRLEQTLRQLSLLRANQSLQALRGTSPTSHGHTDATVAGTQGGVTTSGAVTQSVIVTKAASADTSATMTESATTSMKATATVNAVGSLAGEGGVSGGAASYTIPIAVPPGRHGMQPSVSLSYSSRAGNGIAGMGWSLDAGQSSIQRCARTIAQDSYPRPVKGDAQDPLCLDGQRLLPYSGTYGNSGATYRTEMESFVRVKQNGSLAGATFTVELTDGGKRTYGRSVMAAGAGFVSSWLLTEVADAYGNTIKYEYSLYAEAEWLLTKIFYTGRQSPAELGTREVRFQYSSRGDTSAGYNANGFSRQTMLLTSIQTYAPKTAGAVAELVREYTLGHISSEASGRSLLEWVQECAFKGGAPYCLPETRFTWDHAKPSFVLEKLGTQVDAAGILQNKRYIEDVLPRGDSNGDGVPDLPGYYLDAEGRQRGTNPNPVQKCLTNYHLRGVRCFPADFNNDGLTDSWRHDTTLRIAYTVAGGSAGIEFNTGIALPAPTDVDRQSDHLHAVVDLNGDGWKDLVIYHNTSSGARLVAYYHTGNTNAPYPSAASKVLYNWTFALVAAGAQRVPTIEANLAEDFDGNGLPDIVITQVFKTVNGVNAGIPAGLPKNIVFLHVDAAHNLTGSEQTLASLVPTGESPYLGNIATPPAFSDHEHYFNYFIDVNSDGLSDWLGIQGGNLYVRVNTGGSFKSWQLLGPAPAGLQLTQSQDYYYQDGSEIASMKWPAYDRYLRQMDINGDGKMELLVPGTRKVSACYQILEATSPSSGAWIDKCDVALYGTYKQTFYGLPQPITLPNRDAGVVEFDAISFGLDAAGNPTSSTQASGLLGSIGESAALDVFGKGLPDLVTTIGCGSTLCSMGSFTEVEGKGITGPGVYINRNRGSAASGQAYRAVDTLTKVQEGLGRQTEWVLKPLSTGDYAGGVCNGGAAMPSLYQTDFGYLAGSTPGQYFHFASSAYVVAELKRSNGVGGTNSTRYRYRGAVFDGWGRGFQGFREIITDEDKITSGLRGCSTFSQLFPYSGLVTAVTVQTYGGQKLSQTSNTLALSRPFLDDKTYLPYVKKSEVDRWDVNGSSLGKTTTDLTTLDDYGNTIDSITTVDDAYLTRTQQTVSVFTVNVASWWLTRRDRDTVTGEIYEKSLPRSAAHDVPQTRITAYTYTGERQPDLVTREPDNPALKLETDFDYDGYGNVSKTTVSGGSGESLVSARANSVDYDSEGYFPVLLQNALNHPTKVLYDGTIGKLTESEDPLENQNKLTYDAFARVTGQQLVGALTPRTAATTLYSADFTGDSAKPALAQYKTISSQPGVRPAVVTYFDSFNRVLRVQTDNPVNPAQRIWQDSVYDADGHLSKQSVPYFSTDTLSSCQWTEYLNFDLANRPAQRKLPNDNGCQLTIVYSYNGAQTSIQVGPNSSYQVSRVQNALGQWWQTTDQGSESGYGHDAALTTHFRYDAFGNPVLISRTPSGGSEIKNTASYNALGHKLGMSDPDRGSWNFSYNVLGELVKQVDAKQQHSYWDYDVLGRMTARYEAPNSTTAKTLVAQSVFDGPCLNNGAAAKGLLCSSSKVGETSKAFTYTLEGLLEKTVATLTASGEASKSFTVNQAYDGEGRPNLLTYPSTSLADSARLQVRTDYRSDTGFAWRQRNERDLTSYGGLTAGAMLQQLSGLDAFGNVTAEAVGNGLDTTRSFSANTGRVMSLCVNLNSGCSVSTSGNVQALQYSGTANGITLGYDAYGNLVGQHNLLQNVSEQFVYDRRMRLVQSTRIASVGSGLPTNQQTVDYRFDAIGNLIEKSDYAKWTGSPSPSAPMLKYGSQAGSYKPHQVGQVTLPSNQVIDYQYDGNGNQIGSSGALVRSLSYNHQQVPTLVTQGSNSARFAYDDSNERYFERHVEGGKTTKIWKLGKLFEYSEMIEGGVTTKEEKSYLGGVAQFSYKPAQNGKAACGQWRYLHADRLGSIETVTNQTRQVLERHGYDPFGKVRSGNWLLDNTKDGTTATQKGLYSRTSNRGFTGHDHIDSVGLIHMNGRSYDPQLGRFTGVDPYIQSPTNAQTLNPYSYVFNNPLAGTDPTGYYVIPDANCISLDINKSGCAKKDPTFRGFLAMQGLSWVLGEGNGGNRGQQLQAQLEADMNRILTPEKRNARDWVRSLNARVEVRKVVETEAGTKENAGNGGSWSPPIGLGVGIGVGYLTAMDTLTACTEGGKCASPEVQQAVQMENLMAMDPPLEPVAPELWVANGLIVGKIVVNGARAGLTGTSSTTLSAEARAQMVAAEGEMILARSSVAEPLLNAAAQPYNQSGLSVLARAWAKHSGREGSTFAPLTGNAAQQNATAQSWLRSLLNNPDVARRQLSGGAFEYRLPNGQGARFNANGSFNTVLDPAR